ncbi:MAG: helix-turn-helix domain-containing protein [Deltaproteobacteria bacterium]|nr:helix-turn-helix domain-containing protein [Deltaproteobacteria bacterium]
MKSAVNYPEVYTVEEFAKIFKLSPEAVRTLIRKGEISAIRIGKQYRIPQIVVDRYFAQAISPEERGFGMWKQNRIPSLSYVNKLRGRDRRTPEAFLKDMAKDK